MAHLIGDWCGLDGPTCPCEISEKLSQNGVAAQLADETAARGSSNLRHKVDTDDDASSTAAPGSRAPNDVAIYLCLRVARDHVGKREAPLHVAR